MTEGGRGSRRSDNLKRKLKGVGMFNEHENDNVTRRVKELVLGFETLGGPGVNLDVKLMNLDLKKASRKVTWTLL
jgi:hypothetical protein